MPYSAFFVLGSFEAGGVVVLLVWCHLEIGGWF